MAIDSKTIKEAFSLKRNFSALFIRTNDRWAFLDGYRTIGIFWVILGHCFILLQDAYGMVWWRDTISHLPYYFQWIVNGDIAVDGFLVVSAFLMANMLIKQYQTSNRIRASIFYLSRYMRLTPAYLLAIFIFMSVQRDVEFKDIWLHIFYLQNFLTDYGTYFMPFSWSLAVEEQFYLFLPPFLMFILLKTDKPYHWLIGLFALSLVIRTYVIFSDDMLRTTSIKEIVYNKGLFGHYFTTLYDNLYTRYGAFLCGILAAFVYRYHSAEFELLLKTKWALWLTHLSMLCLFILCVLPVLHHNFNMPNWLNLTWQIARRDAICLSVTWLLLCGLYPTHLAARFNQFMSMKVFFPFGNLLYSMYLFHYLGIGFVLFNLDANLKYFDIDLQTNLIWMFPAFIGGIICTMVLAIISFLTIEIPIMNLRPKA